jgi:nitrate/TMAO reductase-like tetraheme cytochrome c subunit
MRKEKPMKKLMAYLSGTMFIALSVASAYSVETAIKDAKTLFENKCGTCHSIERATSKKKTAEEWKTSVMRMKNVNGCAIADNEAQIIIGYLAKNFGK